MLTLCFNSVDSQFIPGQNYKVGRFLISYLPKFLFTQHIYFQELHILGQRAAWGLQAAVWLPPIPVMTIRHYMNIFFQCILWPVNSIFRSKPSFSCTCSLFNFSRFRISSINNRALSRSWRSLCQYFNFSFKACVSSSSSLLRQENCYTHCSAPLTLLLEAATSKHFKKTF